MLCLLIWVWPGITGRKILAFWSPEPPKERDVYWQLHSALRTPRSCAPRDAAFRGVLRISMRTNTGTLVGSGYIYIYIYVCVCMCIMQYTARGELSSLDPSRPQSQSASYSTHTQSPVSVSSAAVHTHTHRLPPGTFGAGMNARSAVLAPQASSEAEST